MNDVKLVLAKFGKLFVDRRLWLGVLVLVMTVMGLPDDVVQDTATQLDPEAQELVLVIAKLLALFGIPSFLLVSFGIREPSGAGKSVAIVDVDTSRATRKLKEFQQQFEETNGGWHATLEVVPPDPDVGKVAEDALIAAGADLDAGDVVEILAESD